MTLDEIDKDLGNWHNMWPEYIPWLIQRVKELEKKKEECLKDLEKATDLHLEAFERIRELEEGIADHKFAHYALKRFTLPEDERLYKLIE